MFCSRTYIAHIFILLLQSSKEIERRLMNSDRADKILYFPILTFGRGDSDASRRFVTWGIEIYNQIIMNTFQVSRILMLIQETAGGGTAGKFGFAGGGGFPPPPPPPPPPPAAGGGGGRRAPPPPPL